MLFFDELDKVLLASITKVLEIASANSRTSAQLISEWVIRRGLHSFFQQFPQQDLQQWNANLGSELKTSSKAKLIDGLIAATSRNHAPTTKKRVAPPKDEPKPAISPPKKTKVEKADKVEAKAQPVRHIPTVYENGKMISMNPDLRAKLLQEASISTSSSPSASSASSTSESREDSEEEEIRFVPRPELEKGITEAQIFNNYTASELRVYLKAHDAANGGKIKELIPRVLQILDGTYSRPIPKNKKKKKIAKASPPKKPEAVQGIGEETPEGAVKTISVSITPDEEAEDDEAKYASPGDLKAEGEPLESMELEPNFNVFATKV